VDTPEGKAALCDRLKKEVNHLLTTGKIKKVWIKTLIIKP
jgi:flagellar basal body-associated protein FliL